MNLGRALTRTAMVSMAATLVFSSPPAKAAEDVSDLGHISASVTGLLNVTERSAIKFGNFSITCPAGVCDANTTIVLSEKGTRTKVDGGTNTTTLLYGVGGLDPGVANGTDYETGSQVPGFYDIVTGEGAQDVYVSFADNTGKIIDASHPDNFVTLTGSGAPVFTVDTFTFDSDDGTTGYAGADSTTDIYGKFINCAGGICAVRVGATLHTAVTAVNYPVGQYTGTFYIMVSY